jgi:hypothetical protein
MSSSRTTSKTVTGSAGRTPLLSEPDLEAGSKPIASGKPYHAIIPSPLYTSVGLYSLG